MRESGFFVKVLMYVHTKSTGVEWVWVIVIDELARRLEQHTAFTRFIVRRLLIDALAANPEKAPLDTSYKPDRML